jgi:hypothetical protein
MRHRKLEYQQAGGAGCVSFSTHFSGCVGSSQLQPCYMSEKPARTKADCIHRVAMLPWLLWLSGGSFPSPHSWKSTHSIRKRLVPDMWAEWVNTAATPWKCTGFESPLGYRLF